MPNFEMEPEPDSSDFTTHKVPDKKRKPLKKKRLKVKVITIAALLVALCVTSIWYGTSHNFHWQSPLIITPRTESQAYFETAPLVEVAKAAERSTPQVERPALNSALENYLRAKGSPLAEVTDTLLTLPTWERIIAIANAESTLCKRYPTHLANCWGVGGSRLWDMGDNLSQGVIAMDTFLRTSPTSSNVKYDTMPIARMNGLYKQPAEAHWAENINSVLRDLEVLKNNN